MGSGFSKKTKKGASSLNASNKQLNQSAKVPTTPTQNSKSGDQKLDKPAKVPTTPTQDSKSGDQKLDKPEHPRDISDTLVNSRRKSRPGSGTGHGEIITTEASTNCLETSSSSVQRQEEAHSSVHSVISQSQVEVVSGSSKDASLSRRDTSNSLTESTQDIQAAAGDLEVPPPKSSSPAEPPAPSIFNSDFNRLVAEENTSIKMTEKDENRRPSCNRAESMHAKDIMISYSHKNTEKMNLCKGMNDDRIQ